MKKSLALSGCHRDPRSPRHTPPLVIAAGILAAASSTCPAWADMMYGTVQRTLSVQASRTAPGTPQTLTDSWNPMGASSASTSLMVRVPTLGGPYADALATMTSTFSPSAFFVRSLTECTSEAVTIPPPVAGGANASSLASITFTLDAPGMFRFDWGGTRTAEGVGTANFPSIMLTGPVNLTRVTPTAPFWVETFEMLTLPAGQYTMSAVCNADAPLFDDDFGGGSVGYVYGLSLVPAPGGVVLAGSVLAWASRRRRPI